MKAFARYGNKYADEFTLMRHFTNGEKPAFQAVYEGCYSEILGFVQRFLPVAADAEDITADCFVKLWQQKDSFNSLDHIRGFLFTTARNSCLNFLKHARIRDAKHEELLDKLTSAGERQFRLEEIRAELMQLVYEQVQLLPKGKRDVFLLAYRDGLKTGEIARLLGIRESTVSNQKAEAIKLLAAAFKDNTLLLALILCLEFSQQLPA